MTNPNNTFASPWIVAHRGAGTEAPENSRSAFDAALIHSIDGIELDVQMSKDGVPVLYHDRTLGKIEGRRKRISDYTLQELNNSDWGGWYSDVYRGEPLLTLEQALHHYAQRTRLFIEIKSRDREWRSGGSRALTFRVLDLVASLVPQKSRKDIYILSFDPEVLRLVYREAPERQCVLNVKNPIPAAEAIRTRTEYLYGVCMPIKNLEKSVVDVAHIRSRKVMTYACNVPKQLNKALDLKVDVILTDKPGWLADTLKTRGLR